MIVLLRISCDPQSIRTMAFSRNGREIYSTFNMFVVDGIELDLQQGLPGEGSSLTTIVICFGLEVNAAML